MRLQGPAEAGAGAMEVEEAGEAEMDVQRLKNSILATLHSM